MIVGKSTPLEQLKSLLGYDCKIVAVSSKASAESKN